MHLCTSRFHNITHLCWSTFIHKSGPSPLRVLYFSKLTNSNVLGKLPIRDSNNREIRSCYWWIWQKYNTHVTVKDHIYE